MSRNVIAKALHYAYPAAVFMAVLVFTSITAIPAGGQDSQPLSFARMDENVQACSANQPQHRSGFDPAAACFADSAPRLKSDSSRFQMKRPRASFVHRLTQRRSAKLSGAVAEADSLIR